MNTLVYLSYGAKRNLDEARYSLLSLLGFEPPAERNYRIAVYTDNPSAFRDLEVDPILLDHHQLKRWMGNIDYIHRRKSMTVLDALERFGESIAFVDCDTYYLKPASQLFTRIGPGRACLHLVEGRLQETGTGVDQSVSDLIKSMQFLALDGSPLTISPDARMWNSGVIGMHSSDLHLIREAIHLIDQMWPMTVPYAPGKKAHHAEQFATGHFLEQLHISESDDIIYHYWPTYLRDAFGEVVGGLVEPVPDLPLSEQATRIYQERPQADLARRIKMKVRQRLRQAGLRVPGIRNSA